MNATRPGSGIARAVVRQDRTGDGAAAPPTRPWVVKIGGRALEGGREAELAAEVAALGAPVVLVHGGGAAVSTWCAKLGIEPRFHDGLRVTDVATLEVAAAVLGGLVNKQWVALLEAHGRRAAGLCALDAGLAKVTPHPEAGRLGEVGTVTGIDPSLIVELLARGITPVLASIGAFEGRLLNVNADDLAAAVAGALRAPALVLLSDTPGVKLGGEVVAALDREQLDAAIGHPDVQGGMKPKLLAARRAIAAGAARVSIAAWNGPGTLAALLAGEGPGTTIGNTGTDTDENDTAAATLGVAPPLASHGGRS